MLTPRSSNNCLSLVHSETVLQITCRAGVVHLFPGRDRIYRSLLRLLTSGDRLRSDRSWLQAIYSQRLQLRAHPDRFRSERVFRATHEGRASYSQRKAGWFKESTPNTSHHVAQDGSSRPSSAPRSTIRACSSTTSFDQHSY